MAFFEAITIGDDLTKERDERYLNGGNFFGTEKIAPPPLEPLAIDFLEPELPPEPIPAAGPSSSGAGSSSKAAPPPAAPSLLIKLPGNKRKAPN